MQTDYIQMLSMQWYELSIGTDSPENWEQMIFKDKQTNVVLYLVCINTELKDLHNHKHKIMFTIMWGRNIWGLFFNLDV